MKDNKPQKKNKRYLEVRRKTARTNSGNTITAKRFAKEVEERLKNGTKRNDKA